MIVAASARKSDHSSPAVTLPTPSQSCRAKLISLKIWRLRYQQCLTVLHLTGKQSQAVQEQCSPL